MDFDRTLPLAAGFGAIAGLRTFAAPLAASRAVRERNLDLAGTPLALLGTSRGAHVAAALALGELIADKMPFIPSRIETPGLAARFLSGALAGASVARARHGKWFAAAMVGGAAAIGAAYAGYELRRRGGIVSGLPDPVVALIEDVIVIGSGLALVRALKR